MLGKQRSQMNQSMCYDITQITEWQYLIEVRFFKLGLIGFKLDLMLAGFIWVVKMISLI